MAHSKCACGGNMIVGWDVVDEIWRIKCDSPWHSNREPDPLESLLVGAVAGTTLNPSEYAAASCIADEEDDE